jgi:hypothetical protein
MLFRQEEVICEEMMKKKNYLEFADLINILNGIGSSLLYGGRMSQTA